MKSKTALTPALAAYATGRTIAPLWVSPTGRAFYPIAGGAEADPPKSDDPKPEAPKKDDPPKFEPVTSQEEFDRRLSERLQRERNKFADYEDLKKKAAEHDKAVEAARTDQEKAVEAARNEGKTEALTAANTRLVNAEARAAAAAARFRNPALAVKAIDLSGVKVDAEGNVDADAIKVALDKLATDEPYLVDEGKPRPKPDPSQGGGGGDDSSSVARGRELFASKRGKKTS